VNERDDQPAFKPNRHSPYYSTLSTLYRTLDIFKMFGGRMRSPYTTHVVTCMG